MGSLSAWLQSARPLAQANIALPLLYGQLAAYALTRQLHWLPCVGGLAVGLLAQLYIVWSNDWADEATDRDHPRPTPYSGGSRVLVEGKLERRQLARAGTGTAVLLLAVAAGLVPMRPVSSSLIVVGLLLGAAYSLPPLQLSYRGHGELLQGLGIGVVLPLAGFDLQVGRIAAFPWPALLPAFLLGVAGNLTTALPDHVSDTAHAKRSYPVRKGLRRAQRDSGLLIALAALATPWAVPWLSPGDATWLALPLLGGVTVNLMHARDTRSNADLERFVFVHGAVISSTWLLWGLSALCVG